jgi:hypothetical protein
MKQEILSVPGFDGAVREEFFNTLRRSEYLEPEKGLGKPSNGSCSKAMIGYSLSTTFASCWASIRNTCGGESLGGEPGREARKNHGDGTDCEGRRHDLWCS